MQSEEEKKIYLDDKILSSPHLSELQNDRSENQGPGKSRGPNGPTSAFTGGRSYRSHHGIIRWVPPKLLIPFEWIYISLLDYLISSWGKVGHCTTHGACKHLGSITPHVWPQSVDTQQCLGFLMLSIFQGSLENPHCYLFSPLSLRAFPIASAGHLEPLVFWACEMTFTGFLETRGAETVESRGQFLEA